MRLAKYLRIFEKCDFVVAVTHMRLAEDLKVSDATASGENKVDLILGGHDHEVVCRFAGDTDKNPEVIRQGCVNQDINRDGRIADVDGNVRIVKSGTDWRSYSVVYLHVGRHEDGTAYLSKIKRQFYTLYKTALNNKVVVSQYTDIRLIPRYPSLSGSLELSTALTSIHSRITDAVRQPLLHTRVALEGRSSIIRGQETNLGNMLADAVRAFYDTDIALVNSGGIRCDRIVGPTATADDALCVKDIIGAYPLVFCCQSGQILRFYRHNPF